MYTIAVVVLGALCGGFVTGLAGFGIELTTQGFWLSVVDPVVAVALVVICSGVGQVQSLYTVRRAVAWRRVWPFLLGGIVGVPLGVGALRVSGPLPTIWCGLRGWQADAQCGVYQPYNSTILIVALVAYATQGILTMQVWGLVLVCLPATLLGAYGGLRLYGRVDNQQCRPVVLWLLLASGLVLTVSNLL